MQTHSIKARTEHITVIGLAMKQYKMDLRRVCIFWMLRVLFWNHADSQVFTSMLFDHAIILRPGLHGSFLAAGFS
jgi:hypothetical protein